MSDNIRSILMNLFVVLIIGGLWAIAAVSSESSAPVPNLPRTMHVIDSSVTTASPSDARTETIVIVRSNSTPVRPAL
jgi:hypothetical protein